MASNLPTRRRDLAVIGASVGGPTLHATACCGGVLHRDEDLVTLDPQDHATPPANKLVAIGGSHHGISAITTLLGYLPRKTGLTFAVVLETDLDAETMAARLGAQTAIPVIIVRQPLRPEPDHIYIAPAGRDLLATHQRLSPVAPLATDGPRCSADRLFRSMADEYGPAAVAVILAGAGADGAIGLKLVKERGGVTFAQAPGETLPDEMARRAIATGFVDFVLPLAGIAVQVATLHLPPMRELQAVADVLDELLILLRVRTGHDFLHYKRATLVRRVARRMHVTGSATLDDYVRVARRDPAEIAALLRDFMISVTNFFRDPDVFTVVEHTIVPRLFEGEQTDPIRVWVAGCATGEEVYSIAMLLLEHRDQISSTRPIQIFATDIDRDALAEARAARYPNTIAADVSPHRLQRFFTRAGELYQVAKEVRELILFAAHDVLRDAPFSRLDLMTCRNLLIYLDRPMQDHVLRTAYFSLKPARFLVLGSSENADTPEHLFEPLEAKSRIYVRQVKRATVLPIPPPQPRWSVAHAHMADAAEPVSPGEAHHRMVERYAPPSILVNARLEIAHTSERANRYLEAPPGEPTSDVLQMVIPELRLDLRAAIYAAKRTPGVAVTAMSRARIDGHPRMVRMGIQAESAADPADANLLVWFEESEPPAASKPGENTAPGHPQMEPVVRQLEDELRHAREQLRTTIEQYETLVEELHASNEELQAINEELRSASEEIEASREETDSVNQELSTVNQELKHRIEETLAAKSDIATLMEASNIGVIFLDRQLRIHRFTQLAREIFSVLEADIGRPLTDLRSKLDYRELNADARTVLDTLQPIDREVQHANEDRYLVRLRPYRSLDERIGGVVMTFIDITALRRTEDALRNKEAMLQLAERAANAGVWQLDHDSRMQMSEQCHRLYGTSPSPSPVRAEQWMCSVRADQRPPLITAIDAALRSDQTEALDVEFQLTHPEHGERWLWMLGRKTEARSDVAGITLDITTARLARQALEDADQRKTEFIATLAHELRNPLTPLTMALDIQRAAAGDAEQVEAALAMAERQVAHLRKLVDDLLDVSRIEAGRFELRIETGLSLHGVITAACETVKPLLDEQRHELVVDVPEDIRLDGDPTRLSQVFANLLRNAANYTEPPGTITVTARRQGDGVSVSIADTGVGISADVLPRVFDLFVQAEPILTRARGGIGIGLSLVKQLIVLHGGAVTARSDEQGSCFTITLPLRQGKAPP
jgi:two-component system, chemotaxis family, CheB/CheR fusion protein